MELVGPEPRALQPIPARVLGRTASADRRRPRAGAPAEADRLRRAGLGARRLDPGADPEPARGAPGGVQPDLPVHRPRPLGGQARLRPGRGDVPRQDRRDGRRQDALPAREAPVHRRAAVGGADRRPGPREGEAAHHPRGRRSVADRSAVGVPVPPTMPADAPARRRAGDRGGIMPVCAEQEPLLARQDQGQLAACHFPLEERIVADVPES